MTQNELSIAIIGGGLGGTVLMNALMKYSHLNVHLYESKSEITERGASVGLSANARRALHLIGLGDVAQKAQGVKVGSSVLIVGEGPETGAVIRDIDFDTTTVHRAALLKELLQPIPQQRIHLNKRLISIRDTTMNFDDETSATADVIVGADGIHSSVRPYVLGEGHTAIDPVQAGFWDSRNVVSFDEAVARLGSACINKEDPRQHTHIGANSLLFHDIIDNAQRVCILVSGPLPPEWKNCPDWKHIVDRKWLEERYLGFGDLGRVGIDLLCGDRTQMPIFIQWESAKASKLYNGTICMIGDAAHAMAPWLGAGLAQAIEDSLIIEQLLGRCTKVQEVPAAFEAFDRVRRLHAQRVLESSRKTGEHFFGEYKLDPRKLWEHMIPRDFVTSWDTEGAVKQAVEHFEHLKSKEPRR